MTAEEQHNLSCKQVNILSEISDINRQIREFDKSANTDTQDWQNRYDEMLDDVYGEVIICGYMYNSSYALKELDPIAYRCGKDDWLDSLDNDEFDEYKELVEQLEALESELSDIEEQLEEDEDGDE